VLGAEINMYPKISIITVVKNNVNSIERTLLSVFNQAYPNLEYIIIDGQSTDGTLEIIKKYQHQLAYWVSEPDQGISDAFNKGIAQCSGEWIGIINADDWYEPNTFQIIADNQFNGDILYGNLLYWKNTERDFVFQANHHGLTKEMTINHPTTFVKKEVYQKLGGFNTKYKYAMDYDVMLRYFLAGVPFYHIPKVLANFSLAGVSDTHWLKAYKEVKAVKIANGLPLAEAASYYRYQTFRTFISRNLQKAGFTSIVSWYRSRFSLMTKTKS